MFRNYRKCVILSLLELGCSLSRGVGTGHDSGAAARCRGAY